jgi:hypothetical protein
MSSPIPEDLRNWLLALEAHFGLRRVAELTRVSRGAITAAAAGFRVSRGTRAQLELARIDLDKLGILERLGFVCDHDDPKT